MVGNGAQIIGKVNPDLTIKVLNATDLGNNVGKYCSIPLLCRDSLQPYLTQDLSYLVITGI